MDMMENNDRQNVIYLRGWFRKKNNGWECTECRLNDLSLCISRNLHKTTLD